MLSTEFPITSAVDAAVLQEEIRDTLGWSFSSPTPGQHADQYEVIARATAKPRIRIRSMPIRAYDIRAMYVLTVDARGGGVISYQLDISKVIIRDVSSFVNEP
jgi:hypothetical protein